MPAFPDRKRQYKFFLIYPLLMILCGIGYAKYDNYQLDGDAVAFMDIANAIRAHDVSLAINGYWNPAYAAALAVGQAVAHPSRWDELQVFFWVNFFIFVGCIGACIYFVRALTEAREEEDGHVPALSGTALQLVSLALLFFSFQRELSLGKVRSDSLLLFFFLMAAAFLVRLRSTGRFAYYPLLGAALGLAYLTKSFAFLPSGILLAALFVYAVARGGERRNRMLVGTVVAGVVFAALAGPYIAAISKQRGRLTTGESARLNYCFFIDHTGRWHEWHSGDLGEATAQFKHHEELLLDGPAVYSYAQHPYGTYPLWFDPSYWTDTLKPRVTIKGHLQRLARTSVELVRYIVGHLEPFVVLGVLLAMGCFYSRRRRTWVPLLPVALWGLLMLGIYFPVDLQDRYLTAAFLLVVIPMLAALRRPVNGYLGDVAAGVAILLAGLAFADAARDLGERRRSESSAGYPRGAYSLEIYPAAKGLEELGVAPGSEIACIGDQACYVDHYWARLAGTPIRAEIEVPGNADPGAFWTSIHNERKILDVLHERGIRAIVGIFAPSERIPEGWHKLGGSNFYAHLVE